MREFGLWTVNGAERAKPKSPDEESNASKKSAKITKDLLEEPKPPKKSPFKIPEDQQMTLEELEQQAH